MEQGLVFTVIGLIILLFVYNKTEETFMQVNYDKTCSQKSINDGYATYIFGDEKFIKKE
jgi:hypothetical protein